MLALGCLHFHFYTFTNILLSQPDAFFKIRIILHKHLLLLRCYLSLSSITVMSVKAPLEVSRCKSFQKRVMLTLLTRHKMSPIYDGVGLFLKV